MQLFRAPVTPAPLQLVFHRRTTGRTPLLFPTAQPSVAESMKMPFRFWSAAAGSNPAAGHAQVAPFHLKNTHPFVVAPVRFPTAQPSADETMKIFIKF